MRTSLPRGRLAYLGLAILSVAFARGAQAETLVEKQTAMEGDYAGQLEELARWCDGQKLPDEAAATRAWIVPRAPLTLNVALPDEAFSESIGKEKIANKEWATRFRELREAQGARLFDLAQAAVAARQLALAFQLVHATLREDPDHAAARRLLGYKSHEGKWLSAYELAKVNDHRVWHKRFGWLQEKQVDRYESGERFFKGHWISADEDARGHADIERGWDVDTEHYHVRTNHSLEEGVRLATRLEEFYRVWRQVFVRFYLSDRQLALLFRDGARPTQAPRRHEVIYFRDRGEYNEALAREYPNIALTAGYYSAKTRKAYFFAGANEDESNPYHEPTHQLFFEFRPVKESARDANFWIVEGIACFMESYQQRNRLVTLGGADADRLRNARSRLLQDEFYLPLAELCGLGMTGFQHDQGIRMLYGEASGMTYFLMFAHEGRYRQALVDYLAAVYANRDRRETLADLTGTSYGELDEQYRHFIQHLP